MKKLFCLFLPLLLILSGCGAIEWFPDGTTPNVFSFAYQNGVATTTTVTSEPITITGNNYPADISISNGEYSIGGTGADATYTRAAGKINSGQTITVRHTSAATFETETATVLTIGGVSATFTSKTKALGPVTSDPTNTFVLTDGTLFSELDRAATSDTIDTITEDIYIELQNTGTSPYHVKAGYVALAPNGAILFQGDITSDVTFEPDEISPLLATAVFEVGKDVVIDKWMVVSLTRITP